MIEPEFLKYFATLGVGGVLAGFIFWFYRKDSNEHAKAWQGQSEMLVQVVRENTAAITSLQATTTSLQGAIGGLQKEMSERESWWRSHFPRV